MCFSISQAALWDNAELLEDLLASEEIAHIGSRDSWGRTPLHAAATTYSSRCLRVLLQSGGESTPGCVFPTLLRQSAQSALRSFDSGRTADRRPLESDAAALQHALSSPVFPIVSLMCSVDAL